MHNSHVRDKTFFVTIYINVRIKYTGLYKRAIAYRTEFANQIFFCKVSFFINKIIDCALNSIDFKNLMKNFAVRAFLIK